MQECLICYQKRRLR
jgi:hypothetical protein